MKPYLFLLLLAVIGITAVACDDQSHQTPVVYTINGVNVKDGDTVQFEGKTYRINIHGESTPTLTDLSGIRSKEPQHQSESERHQKEQSVSVGDWFYDNGIPGDGYRYEVVRITDDLIVLHQYWNKEPNGGGGHDYGDDRYWVRTYTHSEFSHHLSTRLFLPYGKDRPSIVLPMPESSSQEETAKTPAEELRVKLKTDAKELTKNWTPAQWAAYKKALDESPIFGGGPVKVRGYFRRDGTYVRPHTRTAPDGIRWNNKSYHRR